MLETAASALRMAVPVLLAGLGAIYTERSGVVNIGLEGMMIVGSFWGAVGALYYGPLAGMAAGIAAGVALALVHAVVSVTFRVDQIVSGVALNILAYGATRFASIAMFKMATTTPAVPRLGSLNLPGVTALSPLVLVALLLVPITAWVLNRTVFGLRLRSAGENPLAADSLGVNVLGAKYAGVLISGAFAGLAGTYLAVEHVGQYVEGMTQGRGFIALAAMIFGNWTPAGTLGASLLFGLAEALSLRAVGGTGEAALVPYQFIKMIPYLLTLAVLAGIVRRATPPSSVGVPYRREEA